MPGIEVGGLGAGVTHFQAVVLGELVARREIPVLVVAVLVPAVRLHGSDVVDQRVWQ
jgi:hypothetical protein